MLVSTESLFRHLGDPSWVIFDCRHDLADFEKGARLYLQQHIPGAHFASVETALSGPKTGSNGRHPLPEPQAFADFLGRHGASDAKTIVAYDDVGGQYAARLWWLARWIGLETVVLLDGGFPRWLAEGRPVTAEVPVPRPIKWQAQPDSNAFWDTAEVERRRGRPDSLLIDARAPERFRGEMEPIDHIAGRIPGAVNRFFKANLDANQLFRPAPELKSEYETLLAGRDPRDVAHQCGSGVTACVNLFAMEYAGLKGSKLYPGSWSEWIADPARPVAKGAG